MAVVRVLCFIAVLHCLSAFVLDKEKVNQEKQDIKRIIELLRKEKLHKLADAHVDEFRSTSGIEGKGEEDEDEIPEELEAEKSLSLFENSETRGFLEKLDNKRQQEENEERVKEEEEAEDLEGRSLLDTNGHGAEIDGDVEPGEDPELFSLLNSFLDEKNGVQEQGAGLDHTYKAKKDGMDSHKLTHQQKVELGLESERDGETKRNFLTNTNILWPQGIIPYQISSGFSSSERSTIEAAIAEMAAKTCVKFQPKTTNHATQLGHSSFINFFSERGCWSYVGRVFGGQQDISLQSPGCVSNSITLHEMCHAIGQMHEQSRSDRDNYVTMLWNNIQGGTGNNNMAKDTTLDNNEYDHESVLQYSLYAFSNNGNPTMEFTDRRLDFLADSAVGLMFYDVKDITAAYQCSRNCNNAIQCENGGFQDHTCGCYCPDGLTGDRCQFVDSDNTCGGIIDVSGGPATITSPNYPNNYDVNAQCTWLVKGGPTDFIRVSIDDLHLTDNNAGRCYHWLEVQFNLIGQTGPRRCGDVVGEEYTTTIDGNPNLMLLRFDSKFSSDRQSSKGFSLTVSATGAGCSLSPCVEGTCTATTNGGYTCSCFNGFSGQNCDIPSATTVLSCTFEQTSCFLGQATDDTFDWQRMSGSTPSSGTGPSTVQSGSYYLYAEMSSPRVQGDIARLKSIFAMPALDRCLQFWYCMYGASVADLSVAYSGTNTPKATLWTESGDKGQAWLSASIDVPSTDGLEIFFEATRGSSWNSDIAIDTVRFLPGKCNSTPPPPSTPAPTTPAPTTPAPTTPAPTTTSLAPTTTTPAMVSYTCTFENADCFLRDSVNDNYNWTIQSQGTPSTGTGPSSAHSGSNYAYFEVSNPVAQGENAKLETYNNIPAMDRCLSFWYHMFGSTVGDLEISTATSGVLWTLSGNQGNQWIRAVVNLPSDPAFQLTITATRANSWQGDIALDDVQLISGACPQLPCDVSTTCMNGATCLNANANGNSFTCICVPGFTGVDCSATETVLCPASQDPCLNGGICSLTGSVTSCTCVGGYFGQFCDTLGSTAAPTTAPPGTTFTCTFEPGVACFLSQDSLDTFDWTFPAIGSTPSSSTGPSAASEGSYYAFIETSSPRSVGDTAVLMSSVLPMENFCLTFDYHMFGGTMGDLNVLINDAGSASTTRVLWTESGDKGDMWIPAAVEIPATPSLRVYFEGIRGSGYTSDAAIDNVAMTPGSCGCAGAPCQNGGSCSQDALGQITCACLPGFTGTLCEAYDGSQIGCTFEDNVPCFLQQDQQDDFDWSIRSGSTPSSTTGPSSAFEGNKYAFIEASSPRVEFDFADYFADLSANSGEQCMSFAYHMYGDSVGSLEIFSLDGQQLVLLWSRYGNIGDFWETGAVQIPAMNNGQIYITATRGGWSSDIAIDNVQLTAGLCGCAASPCENGGTCTNSDNSAVGYVCNCDAGFNGVNCENPDGSVPLSCTFEDGTTCFLSQVNAGIDDFDWTIRQGSTPSSDTGPDNAHTGSKYAYIETSSPRVAGENAILSSELVTFPSMDRCLRFYYHMKGSSIGELIVLAGERGAETSVWNRAVEQGDQWQYAEVSIQTMADLVVAFEGVRGSSWSGDIALDDIEMSAGLC